MRPPHVFAALSADSKDVALLILDQLPLAALGALGCTCRSLRALVEEAPRAWQAAAVREHASSHPVRSAPDVRLALQRQSLISTNIASRKCSSWQRFIPHDNKHALSDDCSTWVCLQAGRQLLVHNALTGQLLHSWPVPARPYCSSAIGWDWNSDSSALMLPFGDAWQKDCRIAHLDSVQRSGIELVDVHTGGIVTVYVPEPEHLPCQGQVGLASGGWCGVHVFLLYADNVRTYFCVHGPDGTLCNTFPWISDCGCHPEWQCAPSGETAYCLTHTSSRMFLWHLASGAPVLVSGSFPAGWGAWSPSDTLLMGTHDNDVTVLNSQGRRLAPPQDLGFESSSWKWGHCGHIAIAGTDQQIRLYTYEVQSHVLILRHMLACTWTALTRLEFSPDGRHILCVFCQERKRHLAVVSFRTAAEQRWRLQNQQRLACWASGSHVVQSGMTPDCEHQRLRILCFA